MTTESPIQVSVRREIAADPERVFDAWIDPAVVWSWMREAAAIQPARGRTVRVEIDPRVDGTFTFVDLRGGEEILHTGRYLEMDRPRRLVFTWSIPAMSSDEDVVRVDIAPAGQGSVVTLTADMNPALAEFADRAREGWGVTLDAIAAALS